MLWRRIPCIVVPTAPPNDMAFQSLPDIISAMYVTAKSGHPGWFLRTWRSTAFFVKRVMLSPELYEFHTSPFWMICRPHFHLLTDPAQFCSAVMDKEPVRRQII